MESMGLYLRAPQVPSWHVTGIPLPYLPFEVLENVPSYSDPNVRNLERSAVSDTFIKYIEMTTNQAVEQGTSKKKGKNKLDVEPGKIISAEDIDNFALPSTSKIPTCSSRNKNYRKAKAVESSTEEDEDGYSLASDTSLNFSDIKETFEDTSNHPKKDIKRSKQVKEAKYGKEAFPCA
ncbi:hypothetical protein ANN_04544 [Periplaneta americana]|uniref:Uncharacterized protein n=1 Tax=Periplaneta americana TaxID=6978 RepID=A0ABQ8T8T8_PERAM|nr:hypothetical protein ANN_04544 [Periplaneta americana]